MNRSGSVGGRLVSYGGVLVLVVVLVTAVVGLLVQEPGPGRDPGRETGQLVPPDDPAVRPPDQRPKVEVLNGCGVSGIAAAADGFLRERGFDVVNVENAAGFDYEESIVIDRGGESRIASEVARLLGTQNVIKQVRPDLLLEVTVILGRDYRTLKPYQDVTP